MSQAAGRSLLAVMTQHRRYEDYVVFVESKALRARVKQEYAWQLRKLGEFTQGGNLQASPSVRSSTKYRKEMNIDDAKQVGKRG